jgi:hypothetical protein
MADWCAADALSMECCQQDAALQILLSPQQEYSDGYNGEPHTVAPSSVTCEFCQPLGPLLPSVGPEVCRPPFLH